MVILAVLYAIFAGLTCGIMICAAIAERAPIWERILWPIIIGAGWPVVVVFTISWRVNEWRRP
jgi:hypothetical protein